LGKAKIKKGTSADGKSVDQVLLASAFEDFNKAISIEPLVLKEFSELGKSYFTLKLYYVSAFFFGHALEMVDSKLEDALYYAICVEAVNRNKANTELDLISLEKADRVMDDFIIKKPEYLDAYLYKARINHLVNKDDIMASNYQLYVDGVSLKGDAEIEKNKVKFIEAYKKIAENYANLNNKVKFKEFLNKILTLDPTNVFAIENMKLLK
jgi:tetratricopeptide (TPR) repeat protein